jgi:hypothetical protein
MARQAHTVRLGIRTRFLKGSADGVFVSCVEITDAVRKGGVIHERKHPAADTEEADAVLYIPLEDGEKIGGVPRTKFPHPLYGKPIHTQGTVGEESVLCLAPFAQGQVLTGVAEVADHVFSVHRAIFLSSGYLDFSMLLFTVSFFKL